MDTIESRKVIAEAIETINEESRQGSDGKWLEKCTVRAAPHIKEWDIAECWHWDEWPARQENFPNTTRQDVGIDVVAVRRSDREYIAIQCKSRLLDEKGEGKAISKAEIDKFANASSNHLWTERWIATNGAVPFTGNTGQVLSMSNRPIKLVNIRNDLVQQETDSGTEECPHCQLSPDDHEFRQTKACMQAEAVATSVRLLREHERTATGGIPTGQARGKIILPCGTGKTRISLRIVEALTRSDELSVVLCPSIALVAQIRREYLQHATVDIRALAVCSDATAGYDPSKEGKSNAVDDPTVDNSNVSEVEIKGKVTTDSQEIADWIESGRVAEVMSIVFGTYQSGHRIAEALQMANARVQVLVADEAHRTAGLRRRRKSRNGRFSDEEQRVRDFTVCHDNAAFPVTYRVYQTATPRIYDTRQIDKGRSSDWIVRSMDDETVFGVELYRRSYVEAVRNGWLSDYRIIAMGVNDPAAFSAANALAGKTLSKGRQALTSANYLRGLTFALAMAGATQSHRLGGILVKSCIAFMNTVDKSKNMARDLQTETVRNWVQNWFKENAGDKQVADYRLEHLDATSNVALRENAKRRLAEAHEQKPYGIINVGIFGEGTDAPSLNAVAFLEPRKSPIDVIQAVGRTMRTAPGKQMGYIICPIMIPPNADSETWLSVAGPEDGWQELGQILLAMRAHDQRIEDNLKDLLHLYIPKPPDVQHTLVGVAGGEEKRIWYGGHEGAPGQAQQAIERVLDGKSRPKQEFYRIDKAMQPAWQTNEPVQIITGRKNDDGSIDLRRDAVVRTKAKADGTRGRVDAARSKAKARDMINKGTGLRLPTGNETRIRRKTSEEAAEQSAMRMLDLIGMGDYASAIRVNLLTKSGLSNDRVARDLNILESSVKEAAHHFRSDELSADLDRHFGLDNIKADSRNRQADGCTIAALLMMNAAMLHQRIRNGGWLSGVSDLATIKNDVNVLQKTRREWERIMRHDFRPVIEPAVEVIYAIENTGKTGGLERALHHLAAEAARIAEAYADMGADHAGPLFNRVMGNQASDGAFFTRPTAASIAARLALDACGDLDWTKPHTWRDHKIVDLACGSGTLLAAMLSDMKRRAKEQGESGEQLAALQKVGVEEVIVGLDINPVSLQLAASQLTASNKEIGYRRMGLHLMPYGPERDNPSFIRAGSLELLGQKAIILRKNQFELPDESIASQTVWDLSDSLELEDAVDAVKDSRIVIMNPPFTNRSKMGEKFPSEMQQKLRSRVDAMERALVNADPEMRGFADKNSIGPLFVALADHCLNQDDGVMTMINPTIALCAPSGQAERMLLAQRYHIHTVLTCHQPGQVNMSQQAGLNESVIIGKRQVTPPPPPPPA